MLMTTESMGTQVDRLKEALKGREVDDRFATKQVDINQFYGTEPNFAEQELYTGYVSQARLTRKDADSVALLGLVDEVRKQQASPTAMRGDITSLMAKRGDEVGLTSSGGVEITIAGKVVPDKSPDELRDLALIYMLRFGAFAGSNDSKSDDPVIVGASLVIHTLYRDNATYEAETRLYGSIADAIVSGQWQQGKPADRSLTGDVLASRKYMEEIKRYEGVDYTVRSKVAQLRSHIRVTYAEAVAIMLLCATILAAVAMNGQAIIASSQTLAAWSALAILLYLSGRLIWLQAYSSAL